MQTHGAPSNMQLMVQNMCYILGVTHVLYPCFIPGSSTLTITVIDIFCDLFVTILQRKDWLVGVVERGRPEGREA